MTCLPRLSALLSILLCCFCLLGSSLTYSQSQNVLASPLIDFDSLINPQEGLGDMVVSTDRLASEVGLRMLKAGGNAVDAAVATGFALAVTYPRAGNLGGGGFMLISEAESGDAHFIDFRETAPAAAKRDMFLKPDGTVDKMRAYFSHQSAGVPGTVAGLLHALEHYGSLPLETVIQPAIDLARDGFAMTYTLNRELRQRSSLLLKNPESRRVYFAGGDQPLAPGSRFTQPDLATTLERIRDRGREGFYQGETAALIAQDMVANGGLITEADLAQYQVIERKPLRGEFRGYDILTAPPPSSGGTLLIQMLNVLEPLPLKSMGHNSANYLHHLIETMKLAYADRSQYITDPDRAPLPIERLTSKAYADEQRERIKPTLATPSAEVMPGDMRDTESPDTTHYSVADSAGNVVSTTYTLNFSFGAHITVPGTGILLNNEMDDFSVNPGIANAFGLVQGEANAIEPGRRPLSSMTPTIVFKEGKAWLATGSPGGSKIITTVLQTLLNATVFDMNVAEATAGERIHHQWYPDVVQAEEGISPDTVEKLRAMGHTVKLSRSHIGRTNSIQLDGPWRFGYADPRRTGGHVAR